MNELKDNNFEEIIEEIFLGKHNEKDWCDFCIYKCEDKHYLRYCSYLNFGTHSMNITNCVDFRRKGERT